MHTDVENEGTGKPIRVTIGLSPFVYSRLALYAKRHDQTLGGEIRAALHAYVEQQQQIAANAANAFDSAERTIISDRSTENG